MQERRLKTKQSGAWSFTMPTACRKLYTTTGPMKQKPSSLNAALIRSDSAVFAAGAALWAG